MAERGPSFWEGVQMLIDGDQPTNNAGTSMGTAAATYMGDDFEPDYELSDEQQEQWDEVGEAFDEVREASSTDAIYESATEAATGVSWWKLKALVYLLVVGVGLYFLNPLISLMAAVLD